MTDYTFDTQPYIQSQYGNSPTIKQLLWDFRSSILPDADIELFYNNIFNIKTAKGVGLDIWGNILAISRNLTVGDEVIRLTDDQYLDVLLFKALANICTADLATLNRLAETIYPNMLPKITNVVVEGSLANGDKYNTTPMHIRWVWTADDVSDYEKAIFAMFAQLCVAAGVFYTIEYVSSNVFGFHGSKLQPFNQAPFAETRIEES